MNLLRIELLLLLFLIISLFFNYLFYRTRKKSEQIYFSWGTNAERKRILSLIKNTLTKDMNNYCTKSLIKQIGEPTDEPGL